MYLFLHLEAFVVLKMESRRQRVLGSRAATFVVQSNLKDAVSRKKGKSLIVEIICNKDN